MYCLCHFNSKSHYLQVAEKGITEKCEKLIVFKELLLKNHLEVGFLK